MVRNVRRLTLPSTLRSTRLTGHLGIALAVSFGICFLTGLLSHLIQHPPGWFEWPSRPVGLYRITQGVHVTTGFASIPILLAKLWTVFPRFWTWPSFRNAAHAVERISLVPLVAGGLFLLFSGVANVARWYPYPFFFPSAHYWTAWLTIGAMIAHVGAKASLTRDALRRDAPAVAILEQTAPAERYQSSSYGGNYMDWNRVEGNWKQIKGKVKEQWGKLTDDDLDQIAGKREGKIQERYGIEKDRVKTDVDEWYGRQTW